MIFYVYTIKIFYKRVNFLGDESQLTMKLEELRNNLEKFKETLGKINNDLNETEHLIEAGNNNCSNFETKITNAKESLQVCVGL